MILRILSFFLLIFWCACNERANQPGLLAEPPYKAISDSIQRQPSAGLYYRRGTLLYRNNQKALAVSDLKKAWDLQPTEEHALSVVTALIDTDRDAALQFLRQAVQKLPESIALPLSLARGYQQKGDAQKAIDICNQVLAVHPNALDAWTLQAELYRDAGKEKEALSALENAYRYAPFDAELSYQLAFAYAQLRNPKVLALADSLIRMDTSQKHAEPYYLKGVYYSNTGDTQQALQFFNQALQHDYNFLDAYMEKGTLLYGQKKYVEALKTFQLALTVTPTYADAWLWSGKCQEALNNKQEARLDYQRAYGLDKTLQEAKEAADRL